MKIVILDRAAMGYDLDFSVLEKFGSIAVYDFTEKDEVSDRIKDADIVVVNKIKLGRDNLYNSSVSLICEFATGYDNIDLTYARERKTGVANVMGYSTDSVAQITLATVLNLSCHIKEYSRSVYSGEYAKSGIPNILVPAYHELNGKVWGIVGYGNIGKAVGKVARALGCKVIFTRRTRTDEDGYTDIDTLCKTADIITIHTPLNDESRNLINESRINSMKPGVIIVNEARGAVWDESAISNAIEKGKIGACGCDVYTREPIEDSSPLMRIAGRDNVCLTPHMAWAAFEARKRCLYETAENIDAFINGKNRNRVDLVEI